MLIAKNPTCCSEDDILSLEEKYGLSFSEQYISFLKKYNGGYTPNTRAKAGRSSTDILYFYGTGSNEYSFDKLDSEEWKEMELVPIACDTFGNYFVMDRTGAVLFCDHEKGFATKLIAEDFKKFVSLCKSKEIDERTRRTIEEREATLIAAGRGHVITDGLRKIWQDEYNKYINMIQEKVVL